MALSPASSIPRHPPRHLPWHLPWHPARHHPLRSALAVLVALLSACAPTANPRYHLGQPYEAGGTWHYPRESFDRDETGLGAVLPSDRPALTSNGEVYDRTAMTAAHPTLQLPAIARLTNLENGLATIVRINDRGTGNPRRLVEFTPRVATLLRVQPNTAVQLRLMVLPRQSREAIEFMAGTPSLDIAAAPRERIETAALAPPPGSAGQAGPVRTAAVADAQDSGRPMPPKRLPEVLEEETPRPGRLMVRLGSFEQYQYAMIQRGRVAGLGPSIVQVRDGRTRRYRVELGPFTSVAQADTAQTRAMAQGVPDARIVVD